MFGRDKRKQNIILLTGATGYVGSQLLNQLKQTGRPIRCLTRFPDRMPKEHLNSIEVIQGDALNEHSLENALEDVSCAYYLVHSMDSSSDYAELNRRAAYNFSNIAAAKGVKRIIYLGGLGDATTLLSAHLRSRQEVGDILRKYAKNVQVIEFRCSIVIGNGSVSFEMIRSLCENLPLMLLPKWTRTLIQPIAVRDLLQYLLEALNLKIHENIIFEIGGKDKISYTKIFQEYCRQRSLKRLMIPMPFLCTYLSSLWLWLVTPLYLSVGRKLVDGAIFSTTVKDDAVNKYFSLPTMGVKEAISEAIQNEQDHLLNDPWSEKGTINSPFFPHHKFPRIYNIQHSIDLPVTAEETFAPIQRIGGTVGWYYGNWLWHIRGWMDRLLGGTGRLKNRQHPTDIKEGDTIDFWTVEKYQPNKHLRLKSTLKMPGNAWLDFTVEPQKGGVKLIQTAILDPHGFFAHVYWYSLLLPHTFVFKKMLNRIATSALQAAGKEQGIKSELYLSQMNINAPAQALFTMLKSPAAFSRLTPPWQKVRILRRTGTITNGSILDVEIKWIKTFVCRFKHMDYIEGKQFCDIQMKGPFEYWKHLHRVIAIDDETSVLEDAIEYRLPFGKMGKFFFDGTLKDELAKLFSYRRETINHDMRIFRDYNPKESMKILISGASGFIGSELMNYLLLAGHQVYRLVRNGKDVDEHSIYWNPAKRILDQNSIERFDVIINLSGENISKGRWTNERKKQILESRIQSTSLLAETIARLKKPPEVFISASAVGYYGDRGATFCSESTPAGEGFLADVCRQWEQATLPAIEKGVRVINLRLGVVISPHGGLLKSLLPLFKLGLGGPVGSGYQYISWISIDDLLAIILYCITENSMKGPINAVAPYPATNNELTKTLGKLLKKPTFFKVPVFLLRILMGREMADEFILSSTRVEPLRLIQGGYMFLYPALYGALKHQLNIKEEG